ncbi:hypothetical protein CJD36_016690 [Flavipsychrobacter stenotrophus]|uniref:PIN domain-containing protein n=1 Tax=Flavipsychrobacter stenotrophus TaxID=2077091 RepID=A0A2S7SSS0_9BACT|nr:hypothetical protein [Flavipsychrobacter stenotrophus]PQJ09576.1 hypothetical protein CJD36_016690 [Flavipsychrobacter stenotrophus]
MEIDVREFEKINIIDSCSLWNVISSALLLAATLNSKCFFSITKFVEYECLFKRRRGIDEKEQVLINKLQSLLTKQTVSSFNLSIADLQEVELMQNRKKLGLGELSSIAFAKRTNQVFLTDDQKARKFAKKILGNSRVQTTPHLYGWLLFNQHLNESDLSQILQEHISNNRPLAPYISEVHQECLRIKLMVN